MSPTVNVRGLVRLTFLALAFALLPRDAHAQKNCKKGIPCGNSCIAANKTCRIGATPAPSSADTKRVVQGSVGNSSTGDWIASSRGTTYYKAGCSGANKLSAANVIRFKSEDEAPKAGYHRSATKGC